VRKLPTASLVLLLILASFAFMPQPAAAAFPPPVADAGADQTVGEGEDVTLDGSGSTNRPPDEKLTYKWDFDSTNGSTDVDGKGVTVTTSYADAGVYTVTLTVNDGDFEDTDTCRVTVTPGSTDNTPPKAIIRAPLPGVYNKSEPIDFEGTGFDADDDRLTGKWDFGDDKTSTQPTTTHSYSTEGPRYITWTVNDGTTNNTARVVIYISETATPEQNRRPDAVILVDETNISVNERLYFDGSNSSDPDEGDELTFAWDFDLSDGLQTDSTNIGTWHRFNDTGDFTVSLQVRDGKTAGWDIATVDITVREEPNNEPEANAGNDAEVQVGVSLSFRGTASDPDDDNITFYSWEFGDGGIWESNNSGQTDHKYTEAGEYIATFTVEDEHGASDFDTRRITVHPPPDMPPRAYAGDDINAMQGDTVYFQGDATDDFGIALYQWDFNNDGIWDHESERSGDATWTYEMEGTYTAILRVTDNPRPGNPGPGQTDEDSVLVFVGKNQPPEAIIVVITTAHAGQLVRFQSNSEDPEGAKLTYAWDLDGDGSTDTNVQNPTWTYHREGRYRVTLTVTDDFGQTHSSDVWMEVTQSYSVDIDIVAPIRDMDPGETHEFRATVSNDGNGQDRIRISLSGANNKWATLDRTILDLNASEKQTIAITVKVPTSALTTDIAEITVTASSAYGSASDSADITVNVRHHPGMTAQLDKTKVPINRGESLPDIVKITITNTGNGPDTFTIRFSGDITGYMRTSTPRVDLAPGETRDVTVSIDAAESAPVGTATGSIIVSSTKSTARESMDFEIDIHGEESEAFEFPIDTTLLLMIGAVIVLAIVGVLVAKRRRPGNSKKTAKA
jgi:PKD repeat protein